MIEFIGKIIFLPFTLGAYFFQLFGYILYGFIICTVWIIQIIINIIKFIISLCFKRKYRPSYTRLVSFGEFKDKNNYKKKKKVNKKSEFDEEADLWGLSSEDRRIAKEERMSPADYIEAEESDDDELFTDEWE